ncbi:transcriptional regulator [Lactobacillus pasteurii DSM 23907 = CRBIP 24.76]|nr:transcriptional regulator [Lactobacillus pasteurii DSM 23907 = CRBIP 24.76]
MGELGMARKKEVSREKILDIAYKMAINDGLDGITARNIAKAGHFSTQPLYLEFENMDEIKSEILRRISTDLKEHTLQKKFTGKPLIDLDLSYINFSKQHTKLFKAMFVDGKFGSEIIEGTLLELGTEKFKEQYPDRNFDDEKLHQIIVFNWINTIGLTALIVNEIAHFEQEQVINVLQSQISQAINNDEFAVDESNPLNLS